MNNENNAKLQKALLNFLYQHSSYEDIEDFLSRSQEAFRENSESFTTFEKKQLVSIYDRLREELNRLSQSGIKWFRLKISNADNKVFSMYKIVPAKIQEPMFLTNDELNKANMDFMSCCPSQSITKLVSDLKTKANMLLDKVTSSQKRDLLLETIYDKIDRLETLKGEGNEHVKITFKAFKNRTVKEVLIPVAVI